MAALPPGKRIIAEDFAKQDQKLVEQLAYPINQFFDSVSTAFNKGLDIANLNWQVKDIEIMVNSSNIPTPEVFFKKEITGNIQGITCLRAQSLENIPVSVTAAPFIDFSNSSNNLVKVDKAYGLVANKRYKLRIMVFN